MSRYAKHVGVRVTPQGEPVPGRESEMASNSAGGYTFQIDKWARLERFLVLGNEGGTYYATEKKLTQENATCVRECLTESAERAIGIVMQISMSGRVPKNDPAIFALAMAAGLGHARDVALVLRTVCRTGTHLFQFVEAAKAFRGWGPSLRRAVGAWYANQPVDDLAYQVTKYAQRGGWSHRDVLRKTAPAAPTPSHEALYRWIAKGMDGMGPRSVLRKKDGVPTEYPGHSPELLPRMIHAFEEIKAATTKDQVIKLILDHNIPREYLEGSHSAMLNEPEVWDALLQKMPLTAMVRNLGKMSAVGLLTPMSAASVMVCQRLADADYIAKSRLHPIAILFALKTYAQGKGVKGSLSWTPVSTINDALDAAFYKAFGNVTPADKRTLIGLDVSGSMGQGSIGGTALTPREGAAAFAMVTAKTEPAYQIMAFSNTFMPLDISGCSRLTDVVNRTANLPFAGTDCSLPMKFAIKMNLGVDTFIVITDNETWAGDRHPFQALREYREKSGIAAKLVVVAMTATDATIADPKDCGTLGVVGFDAAAPNVIASFSRGR